jgi:DNA processing protein
MQPAVEHSERLARLRLIRSENVGPVNFGRLIDRFGTAQEALEALPEVAARAGRKNLRIASAGQTEQEWQATEKLGARFVMHGDADYPPLLLEVDGAPPLLAVAGDTSLLQKPAIAMVGARNSSSNGRALCRRIAAGLGEAGITVVSGLARGIDAEAHVASLGTGTVAVIAGGIDNIYPAENSDLQHSIADKGLLMAESPLGTQPRARHFPRRNRIISGVSMGVTVIEAAIRSGSLITARQAGEQGRDVFAVPGSPLDPRSAGANRLIREGATLIENADDILEQIGPQGLFEARTAAVAIKAIADLPGIIGDREGKQGRQSILDALSPDPADADGLIRTTGLSPAVFHALVLELEIAGAVERHAGNRYALRIDP